MPVISPAKINTSLKLAANHEAPLNKYQEKPQENQNQKQSVTSSNEKTSDSVESLVQQNTQQTESSTVAKRMVQPANQWRNCSKPHRI